MAVQSKINNWAESYRDTAEYFLHDENQICQIINEGIPSNENADASMNTETYAKFAAMKRVATGVSWVALVAIAVVGALFLFGVISGLPFVITAVGTLSLMAADMGVSKFLTKRLDKELAVAFSLNNVAGVLLHAFAAKRPLRKIILEQVGSDVVKAKDFFDQLPESMRQLVIAGLERDLTAAKDAAKIKFERWLEIFGSKGSQAAV